MKTLKYSLLALMMVVSFTSFSKEKNKAAKATMDYTVKTYINAITKGKVNGLDDIFGNQLTVSVNQGQKILNFNKEEMLYSIKAFSDVQQNCLTDYSIIDDNSAQSIVKITMDYGVFKKLNYITIGHTTQGCKIVSITSIFD